MCLQSRSACILCLYVIKISVVKNLCKNIPDTSLKFRLNKILLAVMKTYNLWLPNSHHTHSYQVGRKWVQMLSVSLVSWKRLRMQSVAELQGCRYPEMMLSSWKTFRREENYWLALAHFYMSVKLFTTSEWSLTKCTRAGNCQWIQCCKNL